MASIKRTLYAYDVTVIKSAGQRFQMPDDVIVDIKNVMNSLVSEEEIYRKKDYNKDQKILYVASVNYDEEDKILVMNFISAKYNSRRNVLDTEKMKERGILKSNKDGDEEKNHVAFKCSESGLITCLYEYNSNGIGCKKILAYIEEKVQEYHKKNEDNIKYRIESKNVVSKDFIESLNKMHKIKAVTLTVDHEDVKISDAKRLSGRTDISEEVDIVLKKCSSSGILSKTVKDFFDLYRDKNKGIKRIMVQGDDIDDGHFTFNTEQMKEKTIVDVSTDVGTGEVNSDDMVQKLRKEISKY